MRIRGAHNLKSQQQQSQRPGNLLEEDFAVRAGICATFPCQQIGEWFCFFCGEGSLVAENETGESRV